MLNVFSIYYYYLCDMTMIPFVIHFNSLTHSLTPFVIIAPSQLEMAGENSI